VRSTAPVDSARPRSRRLPAASRSRERRTSSTKLASLMPRVKGSAWTPVGAPHHHREPVALRLFDQRADQRFDIGIDDRSSIAKLGGQRGVDDVGGRQAEVKIPARIADGLLHPGDERRMSWPCSASSSAIRSASIVAPCSVESASTGILPISAQPSHASKLDVQPALQARRVAEDLRDLGGAYRGITYVHSIGVAVVTSLPLVIAHRGASREAPENTLAAFDAAIALVPMPWSSMCAGPRTASLSCITTRPDRESPWLC